jgi:electron transport complex protein RnfG
MRDLIKMTTVLFITCGLAGGSLAVVNAVTKEPIANHEKQQRDKALREVCPGADEFREAAPNKVWQAFSGGRESGTVFQVQVQGYSGPITMMFGTDAEGVMTGFRVLTHTETPGLGAKITAAPFRDQFTRKRPEQLRLKKDDAAKGQIDAITGATISSRAVTNAVRSRLESFSKEKAGGAK